MHTSRNILLCISTLVFLLAFPLHSEAQDEAGTSPAKAWQYYTTPEEAGFTSTGIEEARQYWLTISDRAVAVILVYRGKILVEWGDTTFNYMCHSMRKNFLSALYGYYVENGTIDLNKTIAELGIDDSPPLNETEKQARVIHLLKARSGIYHLAAAEPPGTDELRPQRGSHSSDTFWWYNNWDFNALGTIFIQETGQDIFEDFERAIADPIGMEDFDTALCQYNYEWNRSIHPQYAFRMSARDRARFGQLFLQNGSWDKQHIVSESWVKESTTTYSDIFAQSGLTEYKGLGYGYMWYTFSDDFAIFSPYENIAGFNGLYAGGYGGHVNIIVPDLESVFVVNVDTDKGYVVTVEESAILFDRIMAAKTFEVVDFSMLKARCSPRSLSTGDSARLVANVKNLSKHDSRAATVNFYLSSDEILDKKDMLIGKTKLPGLSANKKRTVKMTVTVQKKVATGKYYLLAAVDGGDRNRDPHLENNLTITKRMLLIKE